MATDFTQDSLLGFLQSNGGKVKNSALLSHYQTFLQDQENKKQNRDMFKRFVNSVAVVKQEDGVSYIVLKKAYLRLSGDFKAPKTGRKPEQTVRVKERSQRAERNQNQEDAFGLTESHVHAKSQRELHVPQSSTNQINTAQCLPVAGILNNNNVDTVNFEKPIQNSSPNASGRALPQISITEELFPYNTEPKVSRQGENNFKAEPVKRASKLPELCNKPNYAEATLGQPKEPIAQREPFCSPPNILHPHAVELEESPLQQVELHAVPGQVPSNGAKDHRRPKAAAAAPWPLHPTLEHASRISTSTPCISDRPAAKYPRAQPDSALTRSNGSIAGHGPREVESGAASLVSSQPRHRSLPLEEGYHSPPAAAPPGYEDLHHIHHQAVSGISSSQGSLVPSFAGSPEWPQGSSVGEWTSDEELDSRDPSDEHGFKVRSMLHRAEQARRLRTERNGIAWHRSTGDLDTPNLLSPWNHSASHLDNQESSSLWHHSMGDLHDDQVEPEIFQPGITPEPVLRPSVRRLKSKVRSRMCRSLGADLDQPFTEDSTSARHNRLHLLSTSLSFRYPFSTGSSTPPRTNSHRDLAASPTPSGKCFSSSGHDGSYFHRQALVPLESNEHDWLVRGAAGTWTEIYSLFREEPSLLTKRDFITGYTVLHWVAKHGDHRVLNTLWYGVDKMGMTLDINSKTTCGYTPLHLAALHGHRMMIRLLVHKFKANVSLRDTSGKKPWQYLGGNAQGDLLQLLGAPLRAGGATGAKITTPTTPRSSVDRLATPSGAVKRSTSIAAFLKPKSLSRSTGHYLETFM